MIEVLLKDQPEKGKKAEIAPKTNWHQNKNKKI